MTDEKDEGLSPNFERQRGDFMDECGSELLFDGRESVYDDEFEAEIEVIMEHYASDMDDCGRIYLIETHESGVSIKLPLFN